jgi:glycerophosphoryl diester phosphodiesterase
MTLVDGYYEFNPMSQSGTQRRPLRQRLDQHHERVLVIGHRGAMGYRPENTLPSFEHALALGADCVEFDVHLTRDGAALVIHDDSVDRTTNGSGLVRDHTLAELKRLDAGSWFGPEYAGVRIPTLDEVLEWARRVGMAVDIEIKNAPHYYSGIEDIIVDAIHYADMVDQSMVTSFDHNAVKRVGELEANLLLGVLYAVRPADAGVGLARLVGAQVLLPHVAHARANDVRAAHAAGLSVAPWTTSDPERIRALLGAGVDAICTNHPDVPRGVLGAVRDRMSTNGAKQ